MTKWIFYKMMGGGKSQWTVFQHNGPMFPLSYEPHKIPVIIKNKEIILPIQAEEYATMYAKYVDTPYTENNIFNKNFWKDFEPTLKELNLDIKLVDIDFSLIKNYLIKISDEKKLLTKEEKEKIKRKNDELEEPYKFCIIDGLQQQVGNYKIEPPGIFLGRGTHPKSGRIKKRIMPEDIILNLSKDAPIPEPNLKGHKWKEVIHNKDVVWLASWKEQITNKNKYIFTSLDSLFKSKSDESKFDIAKQLKKKITSIRTDYEKKMIDGNLKEKQLSTALYIIDNLSLRVGGNKDTKEEADTVGVTSLRVEHITLLENNYIKLDFLGKDSVRYCKKFIVSEIVYKNINEFMNNKTKKDNLFDLITSSVLNEYLNSILTGLTAKVWRTYNASLLFQKELNKIKEEHFTKIDANEKLNYLISMFLQANASVALLCNHQKNIDASNENMLIKIDERIKELKAKKLKYPKKKKIIDIKLKSLKLKKETKIKMKNISLGTSIQNYIDPRIIFAFIKKYDIQPEKLLTKKLIQRFEWANKIDKDYQF